MTEMYERIKFKLLGYSTHKLIKLLDIEKNKPGWPTTRSLYITALKQVMKDRGIPK